MKNQYISPTVVLFAIVLSSCTSNDSPDTLGTGDSDTGHIDTDSNSATGSDSEPSTNTADDTDTFDPCEPPDLLIVLDRTMSMHRQPSGQPAPQDSHELSKWHLAIQAIETVTAAYQYRLRFGLELFPRDPADGTCVTLSERIDGKTAKNPHCEEGEVIVPVAVGSASNIASLLDPETTLLCNTTPIGKSIDTAMDYLATLREPHRPQYALLLTDGQDTCKNPDPVEQVQALAAAGVSTYVVGFGEPGQEADGIDAAELNNMACAGKTAPDFDKNCMDAGGGNYVAKTPEGAILFISASNGEELESKLDAVAALVGCGVI
jgi:hypothetical protein